MKNKLACIIITYNQSNLLRLQVECIRKFCKDKHDIIVVDNSTNKEDIEAIAYHAQDLGCQYLKTNASSKNGSSSHSFAANIAYDKFGKNYEYNFFLDMDCFPVKPFSVIEILDSKVMAGIGQLKNGKTYFWPGCLMLQSFVGTSNLIDFSPNSEFGLDTGGNLYKIYESFPPASFVHFNEAYFENHNFTKTKQNFYMMIFDEHFLHFGKGSNWDNQPDHEERINSLINILTEKINYA